MIIHRCEQRTDEWYRLRMGMPSASQFHNIVTPLGRPTTGDRRKKYMYRLIAERLLGQSMDDRFENQWTKRGKSLEEQARDAFERYMLEHPIEPVREVIQLEPVGVIIATDGKSCGSPDALIKGKREAVEIKCPSPWVQVEYLLEGTESNYMPQVQGNMYVAQLEAMHLFTWHPSMPPYHQVTPRDEDYIEVLAKELWYFNTELDAETDRARRLGPYKLAEVLKLSAELADDVPGTFPWR